eukprot:s1322_g3.t1
MASLPSDLDTVQGIVLSTHQGPSQEEFMGLLSKTVNWAKGLSKEEKNLLTAVLELEGDHRALIVKAINAHSDAEPAAPPGLSRPQAEAAEARPSQGYQGSDFGDDLARDIREELIRVAKAGGDQYYQGLWKEVQNGGFYLQEAPDAFLLAVKLTRVLGVIAAAADMDLPRRYAHARALLQQYQHTAQVRQSLIEAGYELDCAEEQLRTMRVHSHTFGACRAFMEEQCRALLTEMEQLEESLLMILFDGASNRH